MGLANKLGMHLVDKYLTTQVQGMKLGADLTEDMPVPLKVVGSFGGLVLGSAVGIMRVWNPVDIFDSLLTPESEMEERLAKKGESLGL